jgi:S1-C subfamily serine protease
MSLSIKQLATYLALLGVGSGAGLLVSHALKTDDINSGGHPQAIPATLQQFSPQQSHDLVDNNFVTEVVQKVGPAVVRIDSSRKLAQQAPDNLRNHIFKHFFGNEEPAPDNRVERGIGSGFILTQDGSLMTNAHVVTGADTVKVTLKDGRVMAGKVLGIDPVTDVAVVKINATNLPTVALGRSENLTPGQWAIAIGNPLGLDNTVTLGIISATGRSSAQVGVPDKRVSFIQTDAAINPGNSGGPLLNVHGEVIGINTAIRADAQGLGFAIPINTAQRIATQLSTKGRVEHAFLGIQMVTLTPDLKEQINKNSSEAGFAVTKDKGVLIIKVLDKSPAALAGLRKGDVIQKVAGKVVDSASDVQEQVEASTVGAPMDVEVSRNSQNQTFQVKAGVFPIGKSE